MVQCLVHANDLGVRLGLKILTTPVTHVTGRFLFDHKSKGWFSCKATYLSSTPQLNCVAWVNRPLVLGQS